ncbi:hypothetical protein M9H77_21853 [Catharanthus roseus]|uniref:Uncharacterized protein n=1 Tax=Catharanthus roseus TaxID=4058 RepID=A0ACC0ANS1_CATRO|nr:hypothetical protein M9H77_21853 [Catharanthus roseus]
MGILVPSGVMKVIKKRRKFRVKRKVEWEKRVWLRNHIIFLPSLPYLKSVEGDDRTKEREYDLEKSEDTTKERECLIDQHEKTIDKLSFKLFEESKGEEMSENTKEKECVSPHVMEPPMDLLSSEEKIGANGMENEEVHYGFLTKSISFFMSSSSLCFELFFKEIKLFPYACIYNEYALVLFNSLWNVCGGKHLNMLSSLYRDPFDYSSRFMDSLLICETSLKKVHDCLSLNVFDNIHEKTEENRLGVSQSLSWLHDSFLLNVDALPQILNENGIFFKL